MSTEISQTGYLHMPVIHISYATVFQYFLSIILIVAETFYHSPVKCNREKNDYVQKVKRIIRAGNCAADANRLMTN